MFIWQGKELSEEDVDELYNVLFAKTATGPIVLAHFAHVVCRFWDQIARPGEGEGPELVARQNVAKEVFKRAGLVREANLFELTRRMLEVPPPAPLREKTE